MRTILIAFLMTLATQVGAQQLTVAVSALLSDAQVKLENQNFAGQIDGVSVTTEYMLSPDWHLAYEHLSGSGISTEQPVISVLIKTWFTLIANFRKILPSF